MTGLRKEELTRARETGSYFGGGRAGLRMWLRLCSEALEGATVQWERENSSYEAEFG